MRPFLFKTFCDYGETFDKLYLEKHQIKFPVILINSEMPEQCQNIARKNGYSIINPVKLFINYLFYFRNKNR